MKTLVVTSEITFVPSNYDQLIVELAKHSHVAGLLVLKNWDVRLLLKALGLMGLGAVNVGKQLLKNRYGKSRVNRERAYYEQGKPVWYLDTINCEAANKIVSQNSIELILNARTRFIYKDAILNAPTLGCINIHHGLLPGQRGTMCDLWALFEGTHAGFTVHAMNSKIDDGAILRAQVVDQGIERNFLSYLHRAARNELDVVGSLLNQINETRCLQGEPNVDDTNSPHSRNPTRHQIQKMKRKGMIL